MDVSVKYLRDAMIRSVSQRPAPSRSGSGAPPGAPAGEGVPALTLDRLAGVLTADAALVEGVEGAPAQRRRLLEAGFTAGSPVRFLMATPFGDPLVFSLRGASIALRKTEARCVRVRF